jgi:MoxR-like ATPase
MMLTFEDKNSLLNAILLPNKKFMETLVHILELYGHALSESDIEILTDREKSKRLLKQDYPVLLEVDPSKDKMEQIHKSGNYRYYANKKCMIKGKEYFYTSQLYGYGDATSHGDNRTPLWKWVCDKFDISPEEDAWWPSLQDYTPDISKEQWIALLEDPKIIGPVWGEVLAMFYTEKEGATCKFIEQKFGKKSGSVNPTCMHLAKCIQEKTSRPIIESEDNPGQKKYWPILFQGREAKKDEPGTWVWRLRSELYDALTEVNILRFLPKGGEKEMKTKDILEKIKQYIAAKGFTYKDNLVENFYLSLKSKPFVILAGTSGTGKTKLVKLFAEAIGANYKLVSVHPDWSDSSDLFGHVNLKNEFVPGAIIDYVKRAELDSDNPYFLCLDEMNLARVEYYLSDFLSIIETRHRSGNGIVTDEIILDKVAEKKYGKVILPDNLYVIGTVNMDETTFPFSKKVLDRANTIEFSYVDLVPDFEEEHDSIDPVSQKNDFLVTEYITLKTDTDGKDRELIVKICEELQDINMILQKANAHVGYRVRDEIVFYMLNNDNAELLNYEEAFDFEIMQKILPRIQGSSGAVKEMLCELFKKFAGDYTGLSQASISEQMQEYINGKNCKYRRSAEKICYMMRRFEEDGFTSYWL